MFCLKSGVLVCFFIYISSAFSNAATSCNGNECLKHLKTNHASNTAQKCQNESAELTFTQFCCQNKQFSVLQNICKDYSLRQPMRSTKIDITAKNQVWYIYAECLNNSLESSLLRSKKSNQETRLRHSIESCNSKKNKTLSS